MGMQGKLSGAAIKVNQYLWKVVRADKSYKHKLGNEQVSLSVLWKPFHLS